MDLENSWQCNSWLLPAGMNQDWHTMAITDVPFYSGPEKKILTFQILSEMFTKGVVI